MKVGDTEYQHKLRRYNDLDARRTWLTLAEHAEYSRLGAQLHNAELANAAAGDVAQGAIQAVVDDYAFAVGLAGDLGGAEPI